MALNQILKALKRHNTLETAINWKYFLYFFSIIIIFLTLIVTSNLINQKNIESEENFNSLLNTKEFGNLRNFFISKINSPYQEINYIIKNNDSVERILKKFQIKTKEIQIITKNLKSKKLTNIYAGRELTLIIKKTENEKDSVINIVYPVNNTLNIEIRKSGDNFLVKENILKLYKKEVVLKRN